MPITTFYERGIGVGEERVFEIKVQVTKTELETLNLTPKYIELELKNLFSSRRTPKEMFEDGVEEFFHLETDIDKLFVDHLVRNLEQRSILQIVIFLSRYCGWDRIRKQMDEFIEKLGRGQHA